MTYADSRCSTPSLSQAFITAKRWRLQLFPHNAGQVQHVHSWKPSIRIVFILPVFRSVGSPLGIYIAIGSHV